MEVCTFSQSNNDYDCKNVIIDYVFYNLGTKLQPFYV